MNQGQLNESFGSELIAHLIAQGIDFFCLCPGFRSTTLALALANNKKAKTLVHFDERGAAFHALGYAKATKKPAAIVVTSGTAVGNLMPAVMEASASLIPLILLTCDRPINLRDTMANQTCDQIKIFGDYVRYFFDLSQPMENLEENFLATTISGAVSHAQFPHPGPVQINCPFPEPFFCDEPLITKKPFSTTYYPPEITVPNSKHWAKILSQYEKGVIVLGQGACAPSAKVLCQKLGWPIFADILSSYRELGEEEQIKYYHHILKSLPDLRADVVLHLGSSVVSKVLLGWMAKSPELIHVASHNKRCDPLHSVTNRIIGSPEIFCEKVATQIEEKPKDWIDLWKRLSHQVENALKIPIGSEIGVIPWIDQMAAKDTALFLANSMPIRDADMFFFPQKPCGPIFANRGLSGIDGNIATIAGIAQTMPVVGIIGDQTALHDLNSLSLLQRTKFPVQLIIINNSGGGIFSFVKIANRPQVLDTYFAASHPYTFSHAAAQFNLSYTPTDSIEEIQAQPGIVELASNRSKNLQIHQTIDQEIKDSLYQLCSCFSMDF
jgi:2-succinyl-5-enolpyruvyl-6-hydroxy-3-cyclohexene-1-carboxylate synthase